MENRVSISFRVKDKGGKSGGKWLSGSVPAFDWESFKNTPNAESFAKKAYFATVQKILREVEEHTNGSNECDLDSVETVIVRSLTFTQDEIKAWFKTRDWSRVSQVPNIAEVLPVIEKKIPQFAARGNPFSLEKSGKIADKIIAAVADDQDPIADYLFTILTTQREDELLAI